LVTKFSPPVLLKRYTLGIARRYMLSTSRAPRR
jgi:hypothetical protein